MSVFKSNQLSDPRPKNCDIAIFGEVLFDCFPDGRRVLGGAPFNVAWALQAFGQSPLLLSSVGCDAEGRSILAEMGEWGLSRAGMTEHEHAATGTVEVTVQAGEPSYTINQPRAWDFIQGQDGHAAPLIYHGALALRSDANAAALRSMLQCPDLERFFDVNLRPPHTPLDRVREWMHSAAWVKLNIDELRAVLAQDSIRFDQSDDAVDRLRRKYSIRNVLLTAGADGAKIRGMYGSVDLVPAPRPKSFVDSVGAGDSFTAVVLHGILNALPAEAVIARAGRFSAKVCGLNGATTKAKDFYRLDDL